MGVRDSQDVVEVVQDAHPNVRPSQLPVTVIQDAKPSVHLSQLPVEIVQDARGNIRLSQETVEAIMNAYPGVHPSQVTIEVIGIFIEVPMPLVYPTLPGKKPTVGWETQFFNTPEEVTVSGGKVTIGLSDVPVHTFTLSYEFVRWDLFYREEQNLRGFFGANRGNLGRFLFKFEQDYKVTAQKVATTDGTTRIYTLIRSYGVGENSFSEPIGYVDQTKDFNLYLNGKLQDKSTYTIDTTVGAQQQIIFTGVPTTGQEIAVDMEYFYFCKFVDSKISIDKFLLGFSSADKIQIETCPAGT